MKVLLGKTVCFASMFLAAGLSGIQALGQVKSEAAAGVPGGKSGVILLDTSRQEALPYDAGKVKFIATAQQTNSAFAVVELIEMPGYKTAWHRHNNCEETFYVLEGVLTIKIDGRTQQMPAGSFVHIPRGTPHGQGNFGDKPVRLLTTFTPGGFDEFFADRVELFKTTKPGDAAFRNKFNELRAKHKKWVEILGTWEPGK